MSQYNFINNGNKLLEKLCIFLLNGYFWKIEKMIVFLLKMLYDIIVKLCEGNVGR